MLQSLIYSTPSTKEDIPHKPDLHPDELEEPDPRLLELVQEGSAPSINVVRTDVDPMVMREIISHQTSLRKVLATVDKGFKVLDVENHLIKRILYKGSNKFRNDHGFKTMQILKKSVEKCIFNYPKTYIEDFLAMLPRVVQISVHLPPASLAEHAGLRAWVTIQSLKRIMHCCHLIAVHASRRNTLGHEVHAAVLRLSISGRMWVVAKFTLKHMARVMEHLYGCTKSIPIGKNFYSEDNLGRIFSGYNTKKTTITLPQSVIQHFELGKKVSRSFIAKEKKRQESLIKSFGNDSKKSKKKTKKIKDSKSNHTGLDLSTISNLKTMDDLQSFLESETKLRKVNRKESVTRYLSQDQWKALKGRVWSGFIPQLPNKSIKISRKLLKEALLN